MRKFFSILSVLTLRFPASVLPCPLPPGDFQGFDTMQILQTLELHGLEANGHPFGGISDLAWDETSRTLYAVNDRGILFRADFVREGETIRRFALTGAVPLTDRRGRPLEGKKNRDAEGMTPAPGGNLLIVYERRPRAILYRPDGRTAGRLELPGPLRKASRYRGKNKMLEAVARHPLYGMVTGAEIALEKEKKGYHTLYAARRKWRFKAHGSLTALEVTSRGSFLILERRYDKKRRRIVTLSIFDPARCGGKKECRPRILARMESDRGWRVENYEGLTRLTGGYYLMISDDNFSPERRTLLTLFRISE